MVYYNLFEIIPGLQLTKITALTCETLLPDIRDTDCLKNFDR